MIALSRRVTVAAALPVVPLVYRFLTIFRFYTTAGAAQPQLDPDYYCYNDNNSNHCEPSRNRLADAPIADSESSVPRRGVHWAFIGYPRIKKRVYVEKLSQLLEVPYISMASLVRQELKPGTSLYKQIANAVNRGQLVPEDIIFGLLSKKLEDGYYIGETGFILDGIPRSRLQAEILDELAKIDLVVNFKCTDDFLIKHQEGSASAIVMNYVDELFSMVEVLMLPQHNQLKCSTIIAEGVWKDKLQAYVEKSKPLEDYYRKQKKLLDFQVDGAPGETWQGLLAALRLQHINAVNCSKKLTSGYTLL